MVPKNLKKQYIRSGNPIAEASRKYLDDLVANAMRRREETQFNACVGDTVWCRFLDTPKGEVNPGTIIRIEIDSTTTVYTVLPDNSTDYETFVNEDFGELIFKEED